MGHWPVHWAHRPQGAWPIAGTHLAAVGAQLLLWAPSVRRGGVIARLGLVFRRWGMTLPLGHVWQPWGHNPSFGTRRRGGGVVVPQGPVRPPREGGLSRGPPSTAVSAWPLFRAQSRRVWAKMGPWCRLAAVVVWEKQHV